MYPAVWESGSMWRSAQVLGVAWRVKVRLELWRLSHLSCCSSPPILSPSPPGHMTSKQTAGLSLQHRGENPTCDSSLSGLSVLLHQCLLCSSLLSQTHVQQSISSIIMKGYVSPDFFSLCLQGTSCNIFGFWNFNQRDGRDLSVLGFSIGSSGRCVFEPIRAE